MELDIDEVHVWLVPLDCPAAELERRELHLAPDERARARRLLDGTARRHFVAARGAMRVLLGRYLDTEPADVRLTRRGEGKPCLHPPAELHFNASHAAGLAAIAVARQEVGIDIERVRPVPRMGRIARRVFGGDELAELQRLAGDDAQRAFFRFWTRMEARAKWNGGGVWQLLAAGETAELPHFLEPPLPLGFVGAVAVARPAALVTRDY